jgi:hypothetical protein
MVNYEPYPLEANDSETIFYFKSIGVKGEINKKIEFSPLEKGFFNLSLADIDPETGQANYEIASGNDDIYTVMATILAAIYRFTAAYPDKTVVFRGNSPSRNRLYRMAISLNYHFLESDFEVYGLTEKGLVRFNSDLNFEFLFIKKR